MKSNLFIIIALLLFTIVKSESQTPCPPSLGDETWGETEQANFEPFPQDSWGRVEFVSRQIGGETGNRYEVKVDWSELVNYGRYGLTDEEFKSMMYYALIVRILGTSGGPCNFQGQKQVVFYEDTECKVKKVCYYALKQGQFEYCRDAGYTGPEPTYTLFNGWRYYGRLTEYVSCGTTSCCEIVYTVECQNGVVRIISRTSGQLSGSECPEGDNIRCFDDEIEPCESTCK